MKPCLRTLITLILFNCVLFGQQSTDLWAIGFVFTDSTKALTPAEVLALPNERFEPPHPGARTLNKHYPTYLRFDLPAGNDSSRYLFLPYTMDSVILFQRALPIARTGGNLRIRDRTDPLTRNGFVLPNEAGQYLLKITGFVNSFRDEFSGPVALNILSSTADWERAHQQLVVQEKPKMQILVWFLSITFFVIILVFLSWLILRDVLFGYYLIYVTSVLLYYLIRRSYLFGTNDFYLTGTFRYVFEAIWIPVIIAAYTLFVDRFLASRTKQQNPRLFTVLHFAIKLTLGVELIMLILLLFFDSYWVTAFSFFSQFIFAPVTAIIVFLLLWNKDRFSRIISAGITLLIFGYLLNTFNDWLRENHGINLEPPPLGIFQYAVLAELVIYWLGLLYHWYDLRQEATNNRETLLKLQSTFARQKREQTETKLTITTPRKQYRWARTQVQGFVASGEITECLLHNEPTVSIPLRLGQVEEQLPAEFLRVQRSYVVNSSHIVRMEAKSKVFLHLKDRNDSVPVGRKYLEAVRESLSY